MIIKNFKDYIDSINEGLIKTYDAKIVVNDIISSFYNMGLDTDVKILNNKIYLKIDNLRYIPANKINLLFDHIMSFIVNRGGWFPSIVKIENIYGRIIDSKFDLNDIIRNYDTYQSIIITFESSFDVLETNIPSKLYHLSIREYDQKIKKYGLIPKSKSKLTSHIDRVYLCKSIDDCKNLIPRMSFYFAGQKDKNIYQLGKKLYNKNSDPIIYEIDNSDGFIDKLYKDPNYNNGYYILENIPSDRIKEI